MPSLLWQLHHSEDGSRIEAPKPKQQNDDDDHHQQQQSDPSAITCLLDLPSLASAYSAFLASHPKFASATSVDETRELEYPHLRATGRACFDYCGFGLFTSAQGAEVGEQRSGFALANIPSASLPAQAAYGSAEPGTLEAELRIKVLDYLNLGGGDGGGDGGGSGGYSVVFTASKRAAFGLLAECYDFSSRRRLLTVYDHESESVRRLVSAARDSGARTVAASFRWPTLRICGDELAAELKSNPRLRRSKNRRRSSSSSKGLFVFPTQSRITGAKYSYQWMTLAEKHRWDVLLDVSAMGPKDMGSLGLSLFRPDFIVCSFYKVFGADPTGFGCLLIKNSSLHSLRAASASSTGIGMVRIVPAAPAAEELEAGGAAGGDLKEARSGPIIAFSGPVGDASPASAFLQGSGYWREEQEEEDRHSHDERSNGAVSGHDDEVSNKDHRPENNNHDDNRGFYECEIEELDDGSGNAAAAAPPPSSSSSKHLELLDSRISHEASSSSSHDLSRANGGAALAGPDDDDDKFRRISRDEGLIDSRRSDMFRRFLPIREDIEEEPDEQQQQQMPGVGIARNRGNSSSWDAEGDYYYDDDDDVGSEEWEDEEEEAAAHRVKEPLIVCHGLDHASSVGLNKTNCRLKSLMDWLINSMSLLFHEIPISSSSTSESQKLASSSSSTPTTTKRFRRRPLVQIFGPKAQPDRGPAVAFNLYDVKGVLIQPSLVQKLADRSSISLGCGCLSSIFLEEIGAAGESNNDGPQRRRKKRLPEKCSSMVFKDHGRGATAMSSMKRMSNIPVLTATLGFVSSFEDVYRLWAFAARFLDPEFVSGEALRYQSLNQETVVLSGEAEQEKQSGGRPSM